MNKGGIMNLNYILNNNPQKQKFLENQGIDLETLFYICEDFFSIAEDLEFSNQKQFLDFTSRLKSAYDASCGKQVKVDTNSTDQVGIPAKLSVDSKKSSKTYFFKLVPGQTGEDKHNSKYVCEVCEAHVRRQEVKNHITSEHETN